MNPTSRWCQWKCPRHLLYDIDVEQQLGDKESCPLNYFYETLSRPATVDFINGLHANRYCRFASCTTAIGYRRSGRSVVAGESNSMPSAANDGATALEPCNLRRQKLAVEKFKSQFITHE